MRKKAIVFIPDYVVFGAGVVSEAVIATVGAVGAGADPAGRGGTVTEVGDSVACGVMDGTVVVGGVGAGVVTGITIGAEGGVGIVGAAIGAGSTGATDASDGVGVGFGGGAAAGASAAVSLLTRGYRA